MANIGQGLVFFGGWWRWQDSEYPAEQIRLEPVRIQMVKWFGLVPFSFQFFTRLAAVFAQEFGEFLMLPLGQI